MESKSLVTVPTPLGIGNAAISSALTVSAQTLTLPNYSGPILIGYAEGAENVLAKKRDANSYLKNSRIIDDDVNVVVSTPLVVADGALRKSTTLDATWNEIVLGVDAVNAHATANTLQDISGLWFDVVPGGIYEFEFDLVYTSAATTTGSRWSINGPASPTSLIYDSTYQLSTTAWTENLSQTAYDQPADSNASSGFTGAQNRALIKGTIIPSAVGRVVGRFASEVSGSAITIKARLSKMRYRKIGHDLVSLFSGQAGGLWKIARAHSSAYQDRAATSVVTANNGTQTLGALTDISGNANTLTATTDAARPLIYTDWAVFDGADDAMSTGNITFSGTALTFGVKLLLTALPTTFDSVLMQVSSGSWTDGFGLFINSTGRFQAFIDTWNAYIVTSVDRLAIGIIYELVAEADAGVFRFWLNGVLQGSASRTRATAPAAPIYVGHAAGAGTLPAKIFSAIAINKAVAEQVIGHL